MGGNFKSTVSVAYLLHREIEGAMFFISFCWIFAKFFLLSQPDRFAFRKRKEVEKCGRRIWKGKGIHSFCSFVYCRRSVACFGWSGEEGRGGRAVVKRMRKAS